MINGSNRRPISWHTYKIPDVLWYQEGPGVRNTQFRDTGIKLLNVGNINNNELNLNTTKIYISEDEAFGRYKHFLVDNGDLLIASSGVLVENFHNKVTFALQKDLPLCMNTSTIRFKVKENNLINIRYFYYFLQTQEFTGQLRRLITGTAQLNFGPSHLKQISIPLPPLPEQQRIATILDHADAIRRKNRKILEKYEQLAQSVFFNMFSNISANKCELQEVCIINPNKSEIKSKDKSIIVSFIPMANISETGEVNLSEERYLKDVWKGFTYFKEGDVLFAKITPCMENGKGAIMKNLQNEIGFGSTEFHVLRPIKDKSISVWLYYLTSSQTFRKIAEKRMTGSAGQKRVPEKFLKEYKVNVPPYSLQNRFEVIIKTIEHQKLMAKTSLKKSEALFQSLLQRAFKGELY